MAEVTNEAIERLITTTENLLSTMSVVASYRNVDTSTSVIDLSNIAGYGNENDPLIQYLPEAASYERVYMIQTADYIMGGANGVVNLPLRQLAARDNFLLNKVNDLTGRVDELDNISGDGTDDSRLTEIMQLIRSLDVSAFKSQIMNLERQNMNNLLALKKNGVESENTNILIELFTSGSEGVDQTKAEVTTVVTGDDSVDIKDVDSLIEGATYQLTDGIVSEEVTVKQILSEIENGYRVLFMAPVLNTYQNGKAWLYRSSVETAEGKAYGGGRLRTKTWTADTNFTGASAESTISAAIDFTNGLGFELEGAEVDNNGIIVLGENPRGIALNGDEWVLVNSEGDGEVG